jgi:hypothetical protein
MIPVLLWRCPICGTDDALRQKIGWWKPDRLWCVNCYMFWEVRRVIDGDYQLRVVGGDTSWLGQEAPLSEWYDRMKAGLKLSPISDPSLKLEADEVLWVKSRRVKLLQATSPHHENAGHSRKKRGPGQLFLTSQRLIWRGSSEVEDLWLRKLRGVRTRMQRRLVVQYGDEKVYRFHFDEESGLKWATYIALALRHIEQVYGYHTVYNQLIQICGPLAEKR